VAKALTATVSTLGKSLTLAAAAIGAGFLAFTPTAYYGSVQRRGDSRAWACSLRWR